MKAFVSHCLAVGFAGMLLPAVAGAVNLDDVIFQEVASGLDGVLAVRHAGDGSERLFLVRQGGRIHVVQADGNVSATPFLNIGAGGTPPPLGFTTGGERGLLGLAFHPHYAVNRQFYVYYTDGRGDTVVAEYRTMANNANLADADSGRVILRVYQPYSNHNGGDIHFGADGYLYIATGDGGLGNDPCNSGQALIPAQNTCNVNSAFLAPTTPPIPRGNAESRALLGKILRIDVDNRDTPVGADLCGADAAQRTYGIPADNPFAGDGGSHPDACDEIYHYGLRNPWRFSFDRQNHDLIIGDVGQNTWEELNLIRGAAAGRNFGWKQCEGFHNTGSTSIPCSDPNTILPILAYRIGNGSQEGRSIAGGFRYRGPYTALHGVLFSGDYTGKVFGITQNMAGDWSMEKIWTGGLVGNVVGLGEGEDGHLYVANIGGRVLKITLAPQLGDQPELELEIQVSLGDTNGNQLADAGEIITLDYVVTNSGNVGLAWVKVEDGFGNAFDCTPLLPAGASIGCGSAQHTVSEDEHFSSGLLFTAHATAKLPDGSPLPTPVTADTRVLTTGIFRDQFD